MQKRQSRRYFKSADQFRNKIRDPLWAKYDLIAEENQRSLELEQKKVQMQHLVTVTDRWERMIPIGGPKDPQLSVVYFIKAEHFVKIGIAARSNKRLQALRTATDLSELELLWTTPGSLRTQVKLQRAFEHLRVSGDWFDASEEIVSFTHTRRLGESRERPDDDD